MKVPMNLLVEKELKEKLKEMARRNNRSLNNFVNLVLVSAIDQGAWGCEE